MIAAPIAFVLGQAPAQAYDEGPQIQFEEREAWKEAPVELPALPGDKDLIEVPLQIAGSNLRMFIQESSLDIGADGVVRYTLILRSPSGAENLFYEGIRCSTQEWRTYAYGTHADNWRMVDESWQMIQDLGVKRYRYRLYRYYLCQPPVGPLPRKEMLNRMRYGLPNERD